MENTLGRRDFLKAAGLVGAATAGLGALGAVTMQQNQTVAYATEADTYEWDYEADVVIVGSGSSGTCAAIEAGQAGSTVLILEKDQTYYGGNSALCGGYIAAAGWEGQEEMTGYAGDTPEKFADQMVRWAQGFGNEEMIREACLRSPDAIAFMVAQGREYSGADILPPVWATGDTDEDVAPRSIYNHNDEPSWGHMIPLKATIDAMDNVGIMMGAEAAHILQNASGEVIGVQLADGRNIKALQGVVLACASVDNNVEMAKDLGIIQQVWGQTLAEAGLQAPVNKDMYTNAGDGVRMLREIGANLLLSPACVMNDAKYIGGISDWGRSEAMGYEPNLYSSTPTPGAILVDRTGHRFCQEDAVWGYVLHEASKAAWRAGFNPNQPETGYIYYLLDSNPDNYWAFEIDGYTPENHEFTFAADTLEEAAAIIGCSPDALQETVDRWNNYVKSGVDLEYGRRADMGTIEVAPFIVSIVMPGPMGTFAGAKTNVKTEVLDVNNEIIPRLYAAGCIAGGNWTGEFYPGCGWAILNTVVWGREAGQNVATLERWEEPTTFEGAYRDSLELPEVDPVNCGICHGDTHEQGEPNHHGW